MGDLKYNLQFERLCKTLHLGDMVDIPNPISGGLLHRMYVIETTLGKYAVKALNPQIMTRPTAMKNFINSERIANTASKSINAISAKKYSNTFMHEIDNQFYLFFDWVDGKTLKSNEINLAHCEKIGYILADIHMVDFSELGIINDQSVNASISDWNSYLHKGKEKNMVWADLLSKIIDKIYDWNSKANESAKLLESNMVISHKDLDPKNVMWNKDIPIIIDWEAAGYINPMQELTEVAIYWSEDEVGNIDKKRFLALIDGYKKRHGKLQANWGMVLENGFSGKLGWLEYNLKRSLCIECTDEEEQQLGTEEVMKTINIIRYYADMIPKLEEWLRMSEV